MSYFDGRPPMIGWPHDAVFCSDCDVPLPNCACGDCADGCEHCDGPR